MADRKPFLLRLDPETHAALRRWAADDLRSLNGQLEFLLRRALADAGRLPGGSGRRGSAPGSSPSSASPAAPDPGADRADRG
jgi:hypothetical protein